MDKVGFILPKVLNKRGLGTQASASHICFIAYEFLSNNLPAVIEELCVDKFENGTLTISANNSISAQECHQIHHSLIEHIIKEFPESGIIEVRIIRNIDNN